MRATGLSLVCGPKEARRWPEALGTGGECGHEGLVAKDPSSPYRGGRTLAWLKVKVPRYREGARLASEAERSRLTPRPGWGRIEPMAATLADAARWRFNLIDRLTFVAMLGGGMVAVPHAAEAQPPKGVFPIGVNACRCRVVSQFELRHYRVPSRGRP